MSERYTRALETYRRELREELADRDENGKSWDKLERTASIAREERARTAIREYEKRCA